MKKVEEGEAEWGGHGEGVKRVRPERIGVDAVLGGDSLRPHRAPSMGPGHQALSPGPGPGALASARYPSTPPHLSNPAREA